MHALKLSLRQTLFIAFLVVALIPVTILAGWTQHTAFEKEMATVREKHLLLARNLTDALSRYAVDTRAVFLSTIQSLKIGQLSEESKALLSTVNIEALTLIGAQQKSPQHRFGNTDTFTSEIIKALSETITQAQSTPGKAFFSGVIPIGSPRIYLATSLSNGDTWIAALNTRYIIDLQQSISFGKKGHAAIVDRDGKVLAHPKKDWVLSAKNISKVTPVTAMMRGETGVTTFFSPAMKADMIAGYSADEVTGWGVMIPQPIAELEEHASQIQIAAILLGVMAAIVTALISWWMAGFIAAPVIHSREAARQISKGNFGIKVEIKTGVVPNEMKDLALAFNLMSDEIQHSHQVLEQRVEERTEELKEEIKTRKAAEEKVRFLAMHDAVTGLPNRVALHDRIDQCLKQKRVAGDMLAVLFIDLDGFKPINDRFGHGMGDLVLSEIGDRLGDSLRSDDIVARYGGDEFVVLLTNQHSACKAAEVAEKLRQMIAEPIEINGHEIQVAASIGVVTTDAKGADINKMLREADQEMYRAKGKGKNRICIQADR